MDSDQTTQKTRAPQLASALVNSENTALNLLVSFLGLAQRRGVFRFDESAKIYECIKFFQRDTDEVTKDKVSSEK